MNFSQLLKESNYLFEDKIKDIFSKFSLGDKQKKSVTSFIAVNMKVDIQNSDIVEINASQFNSKGTKLGDEYSCIFSTVKDKAEWNGSDFVIVDFLDQDAIVIDSYGSSHNVKSTAAVKRIKDAEVKKIYGVKPTSSAALRTARANARYDSTHRKYEKGNLAAITNLSKDSFYSRKELRREMIKKLRADKLFNDLFGELKTYFDEFNRLYSEFVSSGYDPFNKELIAKLQKHVEKFDKFKGIGFGYHSNIFDYYGIDLNSNSFKSDFEYMKDKYPNMTDDEIIAQFVKYELERFKEKLRG